MRGGVGTHRERPRIVRSRKLITAGKPGQNDSEKSSLQEYVPCMSVRATKRATKLLSK